MNNFESQKNSEEVPSGNNQFENEENVIKGAVDFIMRDAKADNSDDDDAWTESSGRIGFAEMFLQGFSTNEETKTKILERVKELVAIEQQDNKERLSASLGISGQEGQSEKRKIEDDWRRQHGA